jgi:signal transduction histidine kinase/ligand-binding sensor domain-containing protein
VYSINQGKFGTLWIGTGEGFCRFDGKKFEIYNTKDGLAENFVTSTFKDSQDRIWVGHFQGGISMYDNNQFQLINKGMAKSPIHAITQDSKGNIWLGTQSDGLLKIDLKQKVSKFADFFPEASINDIISMPNNRLWVATNEGLQLIDLSSDTPKSEMVLLEYTETNKILKLSETEILVSTNGEGVKLLKWMNNKWEVSNIQSSINLEGKNLNIMKMDHENHLWLGIYGEGIMKFKRNEYQLNYITHYSKKSGLSNNYIKDLYIDKDHNVWMGTFGSGIELLLDPLFTLYTKNDGLGGNKINALYEANNVIWLATDNDLQKVNLNNFQNLNFANTLETYQNVINKSTISSITIDQQNNILIGTRNNGMWIYNPKSKKSKRIFYSQSNNIANTINHIYKDQLNNIWVATENGAYKFENNQYSKPSIHLTMEDGILHNNIYSIFVDSDQVVWFATHGSGISTLKNSSIINYPSPNINSGIDVNCFAQDKNKNIWLGTYGQGLYKITPNKKFFRYTLKDGIGSNYIYSLYCDANNHLWAGHKNGLTKKIISQNKCVVFQRKDGFLAEELTNNSIIQDPSTNLWFGTSEGLLKFNLATEQLVKKAPSVLISAIDLYFQKTDWSIYADSLYTLSKLPFHLQMPYDQNHFTFHVKGISFTDPDKVNFKYRLKGFDEGWSLVTKEDFVTYPNIPPGNYTFQVLASSKEGVWSAEPTEFEFNILNPFWKTWWFLLLSFFATIGIFILVLKLRTKRLEAKQKLLQEEKEKLLIEITERKKAERKLKESEDRLKETNQELNTFIYRASHDLRGPLSTVKGLTNLAQMEIKEEASLKYFGLIADRINRLDFILKDLINIVEITEVPIHAKELNLEQLLAETIEQVREDFLNIPIKFDINNSRQKPFFGDNRIIQNILLNLIDNGVKYSIIDKNEVTIRISIDDYKNGVLMIVEDNGIGINKEIQHKVFDMFFRGTDQSKGSGLGLYLVKKIVNRLNGKIVINSIPKSGTQVEVYIPNFTMNTSNQELNKTETKSIPYMDQF